MSFSFLKLACSSQHQARHNAEPDKCLCLLNRVHVEGLVLCCTLTEGSAGGSSVVKGQRYGQSQRKSTVSAVRFHEVIKKSMQKIPAQSWHRITGVVIPNKQLTKGPGRQPRKGSSMQTACKLSLFSSMNLSPVTWKCWF